MIFLADSFTGIYNDLFGSLEPACQQIFKTVSKVAFVILVCGLGKDLVHPHAGGEIGKTHMDPRQGRAGATAWG